MKKILTTLIIVLGTTLISTAQVKEKPQTVVNPNAPKQTEPKTEKPAESTTVKPSEAPVSKPETSPSSKPKETSGSKPVSVGTGKNTEMQSKPEKPEVELEKPSGTEIKHDGSKHEKEIEHHDGHGKGLTQEKIIHAEEKSNGHAFSGKGHSEGHKSNSSQKKGKKKSPKKNKK